MLTDTTKKYVPKGTGFLALFALPFAAVGVGMAWSCARMALRHTAMQSWIEVPAIIQKAELEIDDSGEDTTWTAVATYEYAFGGRHFTGKRIGFGNFRRATYLELKRHMDQRKPFHCYIDPDNPNDAVLYRHLRSLGTIGGDTIFATTFGSVGFAILTWAFVAARRAPAQRATDVRADASWLVRADWEAGQIQSSGGPAVAVPMLTVLAIYWNIASLPLLWKLPTILREDPHIWKWGVLAFPVVGAAFIVGMVHQRMQARKFGTSVLQLASTPGVIGGQFAGVIHIPRTVPAPQGFRLKLSCIEHTRSGDDKKEEVLWQDERIVTEPMRDVATRATALPFLFAIPFESKQSTLQTANPSVEWRLDASAKLSGVDYKSQFEVPIFKTADSSPDFKLDEALVASYAKPPDEGLVLHEAGIVREPLPGEGVRLIFPAARKWKPALVVTLFVIVWFGFVWLMIHVEAPIFAPLLFTLVGLVIAWAALDMWFYRSVVEAQKDELRIRGGWFGLGREHTFAASEIRELTTSQNMSSGAQVWKNIIVVPHAGKNRTIAKAISGVIAQQLVIDELKAAVGRPIGEAVDHAK